MQDQEVCHNQANYLVKDIHSELRTTFIALSVLGDYHEVHELQVEDEENLDLQWNFV